MENFIHLDECDSTQDALKEQLSIDESQTYIISCEKQTHGHGRNGKAWNAFTSTLCFSFNMSAHIKPSFTALEVSVLIRKFFLLKNQELKLKWPNDLLTNDKKKCAGILIQSYKDQYLTGIGLNLFLDHPDYGGIFSESFTINKELWAREIYQFINQNRYTTTQSLIEDWNEGCAHLNQNISILEKNSIVAEGIFIGIGEFGEALIQTNQGLMKIYNGTLRF